MSATDASSGARNLESLAVLVGERLAARGWMLATAESCTGGGVAHAVTAISGSSAWFDRGFVTYSNAAKEELVGVSAATLASQGAVSEVTAREMAEGALVRSAADVAVSITGIAGPTGGTAAKPVGMVCFGWAVRGGKTGAETRHYQGDRAAVRAQSVARALELVLRIAG